MGERDLPPTIKTGAFPIEKHLFKKKYQPEKLSVLAQLFHLQLNMNWGL
jgi:hypothetical protein